MAESDWPAQVRCGLRARRSRRMPSRRPTRSTPPSSSPLRRSLHRCARAVQAAVVWLCCLAHDNLCGNCKIQSSAWTLWFSFTEKPPHFAPALYSIITSVLLAALMRIVCL